MGGMIKCVHTDPTAGMQRNTRDRKAKSIDQALVFTRSCWTSLFTFSNHTSVALHLPTILCRLVWAHLCAGVVCVCVALVLFTNANFDSRNRTTPLFFRHRFCTMCSL